MPTFTLEEVSKHSTREDVWIVIKNKVYNVTEFLSQHPGGEEVILDVKGKDATAEFEDIGHSEEAIQMMKDYYIGDLEPSSQDTPKQESQTSSKSTEPSAPSTSTPPPSTQQSFPWTEIVIGLGLISAAVAFVVMKKRRQ